MDIIVRIEYENNYISFIWLIFGYNRLSKPLILAWIIFGFKFWNIFMTIVISISATHFLILRIKPSLDFDDQFPAYTCCLEIPKKNLNWSNLGAIWWIMVSGYKIYIIFGQKILGFFKKTLYIDRFQVKIQKMWKKFFLNENVADTFFGVF